MLISYGMFVLCVKEKCWLHLCLLPLPWITPVSLLECWLSFLSESCFEGKWKETLLSYPGFVTLWKSLENSMFFSFFSGNVWKLLETTGFWMIPLPGKYLSPKVKNFNFMKKLFPQLSTCCFTYCLDLYSLFLLFNDNWTSKTTEFSVVLQT